MKKAFFIGFFVAAFSIVAVGQTQTTTVKKVTKPVTTEKKVTTVTTAKTVTPTVTKTKVTTATTKTTTAKKTASVMYTCPMHPEIVMNKPGKCPKCKMNLVKKV